MTLVERIEEFGSVAFLVSVGEDGAPHTVSVAVIQSGDDLLAAAGGRTSANVAERPDVTLLWPARPGEPYSLIVDGHAELRGERVAIRPARAVLHRLAHADPGLPSCVRLLS